MDLMQAKKEVLDVISYGKVIVLISTCSENTKKGIKISGISMVKVIIGNDLSFIEQDFLNIPSIKHTMADEKKYFKKIIKFMDGNPWIGYDAGVDFKMLFEMAERIGEEFVLLPSLNIINMAKDFFHKPCIKNYSFDAVRGILNINLSELPVYDLESVLHVFVQKYAGYISEEMMGLKVTKAILSYNTITKNGKKIVISINGIKDRMVYYNVETSKWFVDKSVESKVYLPHIIKQVENMYLIPFGKSNIGELADMWFLSSEKLLAKKTKKCKKKA